jgi:hypothetical protein
VINKNGKINRTTTMLRGQRRRKRLFHPRLKLKILDLNRLPRQLQPQRQLQPLEPLPSGNLINPHLKFQSSFVRVLAFAHFHYFLLKFALNLSLCVEDRSRGV